MKKSFFIFFIILTAFAFEDLSAQSFPNRDASPMDLAMARPDKNSPPLARVIYSRPQKKGNLSST